MIVGQTLAPIFDQILGDSFLCHRVAVILRFTFTIMLPLSLNKNLDSLSHWSFLALFGVILLTLVSIIRGSLNDLNYRSWSPVPHTRSVLDNPSGAQIDVPDRGDVVQIAKPRLLQAIGTPSTVPRLNVSQQHNFLLHPIIPLCH